MNTKKKQPQWKVKELLPLSTDLERNVRDEFSLIADDFNFSGGSHSELLKRVTEGPKVLEAAALGFFIGQIHGPNRYLAVALFKTPYSGALMIMECDPDILQKAPMEFEDNEMDVHQEGGVK
jgi:hypothetical protein